MKRNYPILLLLVAVLALLTLGLGGQRVIAYTVKGETDAQAVASGTNYTNTVALFDDTTVHSIQLIISDADYESMITTYRETSEKDYFHADVIIDGVRVNDVGVRLKGNASLMTAVGGKMGMGGMNIHIDAGAEMPNFPEGMQPPEGMQLPEGMQPPAGMQLPGAGDTQTTPSAQTTPVAGEPQATPGANAGNRPARPGGQGFQPGGQPGGNAAAGAETLTDGVSSGDTKIPLLIKFDEYVSGQTYQGYTKLAIRTYGANNNAAMLQEPVTNAMARLVGMPVTDTAYTGFKLNDGAETLYSISNVIDENYLAQYFTDATGVMYKSEVGATLQYQGEDPTQYTSSFSQETRLNDADYAPLIAFMKFLDESDDAAFEAELPNYLDVDSFATYLALNNLLVNTDSLVGMGNNYYLYYDETIGRFTLLMWDANESLGKLAMGGASASYDIYYAGASSGGPMMRGGTNVLFTRFMANATFKALYEQKLVEIYQAVYASGAIKAQIEQYAAVVRPAVEARGLASLDAYDAAVANLLDFVSQRGAYLSTTTLLGDVLGNLDN
ncbi:MAG TPA: CotH kinase family protein [Anaerolineaceae bacterium]|nr:CotH kinase family protein [Anaerolineaceae bacterium]